MKPTQVSIEQVKRDISELVNRVANGDEQLILISNGAPQAAIVSMEDYARLVQVNRESRRQEWKKWLAENERLNEGIRQRRQREGLTEEIDLDEILRASHEDLDNRHDSILSL